MPFSAHDAGIDTASEPGVHFRRGQMGSLTGSSGNSRCLRKSKSLTRSIPQSILSCPLDIHSGNVARKLGLLCRKQNDAKAVQELDGVLRQLDCNDPVKYDFALFGLGVSKDLLTM